MHGQSASVVTLQTHAACRSASYLGVSLALNANTQPPLRPSHKAFVRQQRHPFPIRVLFYAAAGFIEYWSPNDYKAPPSTGPGAVVKFSLKLDTDLFALAKAKTHARSLDVRLRTGSLAQ